MVIRPVLLLLTKNGAAAFAGVAARMTVPSIRTLYLFPSV